MTDAAIRPEKPARRRSPFGFGRERRLRKRVEFVRAQNTGLRATTPHFVLLVSAHAAPGPARLGVVVTRKIGDAVRRNRVKRVCRACFRTWPDLLPDGVDLVVIARTGAPELGLDEVRREWAQARPQLLKRAARALAEAGG